VCSHPERSAIDQALVEGKTSYRSIARQYSGALTVSSIERHRKHLPAVLVSGAHAAEASRADDLLSKIRQLEADCRRVLGVAEGAKDLKTTVAAIRESTRLIELLARLSGELKDKSIAVQVNVNASAERCYTPMELQILARELAAEHLSAEELRQIAGELESGETLLLEAGE
jgi:hypothetical protein